MPDDTSARRAWRGAVTAARRRCVTAGALAAAAQEALGGSAPVRWSPPAPAGQPLGGGDVVDLRDVPPTSGGDQGDDERTRATAARQATTATGGVGLVVAGGAHRTTDPLPAAAAAAGDPLTVVPSPSPTTAAKSAEQDVADLPTVSAGAAGSTGAPRAAGAAASACISTYRKTGDTTYTDNVVVSLDTATNKITQVVPVGQRPFASATTPDGSQLWVPSHDTGRLDIIDTATNTVTASVLVGGDPTSISVRPDGKQAYVTLLGQGLVRVLDVGR